jgi:hypothetical protein
MTVPAMKLRRLQHALAGVELDDEQRRALVSASHALDSSWTDLFADLIEAARAIGRDPAGGSR